MMSGYAIEPLLVNTRFLTEAAPYFGASPTFVFRDMPELQAFLCGWSGVKADFGSHITSITLGCSSTGGLTHLLERCPKLRKLHIRFSSLQNHWLHADGLNEALMDPELIIKIGGLSELSTMKGLESLAFEDVDLPLHEKTCRCRPKCPPFWLITDRHWVHNVRKLEAYVRAVGSRPWGIEEAEVR